MNGLAADPAVPGRPSRLTSLAVSATLVVVWVGLRLVVFETTLVPLTYAIPLLVCVWTRDRAALWAMAAIFAVAHGVKIFWLMPAGQITGLELWTNLAATFSNIGIGALAVHAIIRLREHLEQALAEVHAQADELRAQGEELARPNEELSQQAERLSRQNDELSRQGEELASQNEELQAQAEEDRRAERRPRAARAAAGSAVRHGAGVGHRAGRARPSRHRRDGAVRRPHRGGGD